MCISRSKMERTRSAVFGREAKKIQVVMVQEVWEFW